MESAENPMSGGWPLARLQEKARWVWRQTLEIHRRAPSVRLASSLSPVELFVVLYYGGLLRFHPEHPLAEDRDRLIVSKGHGAVALYPILADLGFFDPEELLRVCQPGSFLGGIPDSLTPGIETVNGSLGHGLGVACGIALALRARQQTETVFAVLGDGELYEGSIWEAVMLAGHHRLDNVVALVDDNQISMLDYSSKIIDLRPLAGKFAAFGWSVNEVDGHDIAALQAVLRTAKASRQGQPHMVISHTVKGHGVRVMEHDHLCHLRTLSTAEVDALLAGAE